MSDKASTVHSTIKNNPTSVLAESSHLASGSMSSLSNEQIVALDLLRSGENVFLTGGAGCGKSFVIREFFKEIDIKTFPILASTGAAAVLVGGRTFHSFFGLGIMEGGPDATYEKAGKDSKVISRLRKVEGVIIDEVSMIPGDALMIAEALAQKARGSRLPWGGLRVIAVGDFSQLPPVQKQIFQDSKKLQMSFMTNEKKSSGRDWCFLNDVWHNSGFRCIELTHNHRVEDLEYKKILDQVRIAQLSSHVKDFLNERTFIHDVDEDSTRLFPRRDQSEKFNLHKLAEINDEEVEISSIYLGETKFLETIKKVAPVPEVLRLKIGCKIIFVQNDPQKRWINGTRGTVTDIHADKITIRKDRGRDVQVDKVSFSAQDADGNTLASVIQFPLTLAYATTIHKSQGSTLDQLWCDLRSLWEPGQAYVAMSRLRTGNGLKILGWNQKSFIADPLVLKFYQSIQKI